MKWSIEEFGDRRCSILVLALRLYHRGLLSDSIPAGELTGEEFREQGSFPNKSHQHEKGQVFLTGGKSRTRLLSVTARSCRLPLFPLTPPQFVQYSIWLTATAGHHTAFSCAAQKRRALPDWRWASVATGLQPSQKKKHPSLWAYIPWSSLTC